MEIIKTCSVCGKVKPFNEFRKDEYGKNGKKARCLECEREYDRIYYREHVEERKEKSRRYYQGHKEEAKEYQRQRLGRQSMYENKSCSQYLGIVIAERLCRHLFKDVEVMPNNHSGYDIICNKGKKIDVKARCIDYANNGNNPRWKFDIYRNTTADYFIFVAFDNRTDLNLLYLWMIPGKEINENASKSISPSTIHKWNKWKRDIDDAQLCCAEIKKSESNSKNTQLQKSDYDFSGKKT